MKFSEFDSHAKEVGIGGGDYFRLEDGENKVRLLTEPLHYMTVFLGQGITPLAVRTHKEVPEGKEPTHRYLCYVLSRASDSIQLAEFPPSVVKQIAQLQKSSEYGFDDLPPYDLLINREGQGMETRYTVQAGRNEAEVPQSVLDELVQKPTLEEVRENRYKTTD